MTDRVRALPQLCRTAGALALISLMLAACTAPPAPVVSGVQAPPPPTQIIVERGQTLSGIAHAYHVPMAALAQANGLTPPYRILVGQTLIVPTATPGSGPQLAMSEPLPPAAPAATSASSAPLAPAPISAAPLPPPVAATTPPHPEEPLAPPVAPTTPPRPAEPAPAAASRQSLSHAGNEQTAAVEAPPPAARSGGEFLWPVKGRIVEGFGPGPDGTRNDGINIAAPRGAAIEATDGGVVAYAGNEVRGYGNLILIKHPNGFISAYAHCDVILVKAGQKVARGQVIARVGATGNVSQPQLHFELRRGKKPVDPREYLVPVSTAATHQARPG